MRDIDDLRHALDAEAAHLTIDIPTDLIRRRARGVRIRQAVTMLVASGLTVAALAVPSVLLLGGSSPSSNVAGQMPSTCRTPTATDPAGQVQSLGPLVDTGATLDAPNVNTRYDVLIGLIGTREQPGFIIAFHDQYTGTVEVWDTHLLARDPNGDLPGKRTSDPTHQFLSSQLTLGPNNVLDVGLYTRTAHRITVTSEGHATDAETALNAATGWTFFWAQRTAAPLPLGHDSTEQGYQGPERVTLTAYDAASQPQNTVTGGPLVGHNVQNPRDDWPTGETKPAANAGPTCPAAGGPT